jgi:hypothetical protein
MDARSMPFIGPPSWFLQWMGWMAIRRNKPQIGSLWTSLGYIFCSDQRRNGLLFGGLRAEQTYCVSTPIDASSSAEAGWVGSICKRSLKRLK